MQINGFTPDTKVFENITSSDKKVEQTGDNGITNFGDLLKSKLDEVNDSQVNANDITEQYIKGDGTDVHQVALAVSEASLSLNMAIEIRNKLVDAYQELNKMQL